MTDSTVVIGPYTLSEHPPVPGTDTTNLLWIQKDDGEGMSIGLDELWEKEF